MIVKTFISAQPILAHHVKSCQPDNFHNNMCFEILGFDILLDHKVKPYVLEVNHTPSFTTDSPLDSLIKKCLIRDTLVLMNINVKTKNEIIKQKMEVQQQRQLTGKKIKLSNEEKKNMVEKAQRERDQYEHKNLGYYEIVYPSENS